MSLICVGSVFASSNTTINSYSQPAITSSYQLDAYLNNHFSTWSYRNMDIRLVYQSTNSFDNNLETTIYINSILWNNNYMNDYDATQLADLMYKITKEIKSTTGISKPKVSVREVDPNTRTNILVANTIYDSYSGNILYTIFPMTPNTIVKFYPAL